MVTTDTGIPELIGFYAVSDSVAQLVDFYLTIAVPDALLVGCRAV